VLTSDKDLRQPLLKDAEVFEWNVKRIYTTNDE
jgi:hypothetical protein